MSRLTRTVGAAALAAVAGAVTALARSTDWFASFGARATGARLERMRRSRQWDGGRFVNSLPTRTLQAKDAGRTLRLQLAAGGSRYPTHPIPVETRRRGDFDAPPESGLRATWMGHATVLLEIDGARVLTDPVWSERVSPSSLVGPKRFFEPPIALADLPAIDAVVLSHDHYDHLDRESVRALAQRGDQLPDAARRGRAPGEMGSGSGANSRARLGRVDDDRRADPHADAGAPLLGPATLGSGRDAVGLVGPGRRSATRLLQRRLRLLRRLRGDRPRARALRPLPDEHRGVRADLAAHPHDARRGRAGARRPEGRAPPPRSLGHLQPRLSSLERAGDSDGRRRRAASASLSSCPGPDRWSSRRESLPRPPAKRPKTAVWWRE